MILMKKIDEEVKEILKELGGIDQMKIRWGKEKIKGFSSPVKKAEEVNDVGWWTCWVMLAVMIVIVILKVM